MCEIVQQWVGRMDNTFWYCRDHKVECESQTECGKKAPSVSFINNKSSGIIATAPWWAITNLMVGMKLHFIGLPGLLWTAGKAYTILAVDPSTESVCIETDASEIRLYTKELPNYFTDSIMFAHAALHAQPMVASNQANRHPAHLATTPWHYSHVLGLTITNGAASRQFCVNCRYDELDIQKASPCSSRP